ncbi:dolichol-phosphate mannosyltransferase [Xylariaceae sp. FL1019]|nr:dolichol-phosphate mannosyltransferase [Xylariaceae sp. FL1019]
MSHHLGLAYPPTTSGLLSSSYLGFHFTSMAAPNTFSTTVHPFPSPTAHACAYEVGPRNAANALVFIGGLGDGPHTVPYPRAIAERLEANQELSYSVFELRLKSSFGGFGYSRLVDDVADISALVKYLRTIGKERIILMGHSTGSQDCMEYTASIHNAPPVEGFILQGPVFDGDAIAMSMDESALQASIKFAEQCISSGKGLECMPRELLPVFFRETPITAHRWYALCAPDGEDNYFSPNLPDEVASQYWNRVDKPLLILHSGSDEFVPETVDKAGLVERWRAMCAPGIVSELSGTIPEAGHRVEEADAENFLCNTVEQFLRTIA